MATYTTQLGAQYGIPEGQWFRTDDLDNIYRRTASGIEAYAVKQDKNKNLYSNIFSQGEYDALPYFSSGIITDVSRALGQSLRVVGSLTPELKSTFGQTSTLGGVQAEALDPDTARLVAAGGAGIGGFEAGGTEGVTLGQALSTTPEAVTNRLRAIQENTPITPASLAPVTPINYKSPSDGTIPDIAGLESADIAGSLTKPEQEQSDINKEIAKLNEQLLGKSAFTTQQEEAAGLPESERALSDLNNRLRDIQRQQAAIPQQLQEGAVGRGLTTGLLGRQEQKLLRNNAIEALTVSSLIDSAQNLLTSAQRKVDRAVAAKYDPIIERKDVLIENAKLIKDSPESSAAERKRAAQVVEAQTKAKESLEAQKSEQKEIWDLMNTAVANGLRDTTIMEKIRNAKNKEEALALAAPYLAKKEDVAPGVDITPENERTLAGSGFNSNEISQIAKDVSQYGLDKVLEGITDEKQKAAIRQIYGKAQVVTQDQVRTAAFQAKPEDIAGLLKATYSDDELFALAKEKGYASFWTGKATDIKRFLESRDGIELYATLLFDQYKAQGLTE